MLVTPERAQNGGDRRKRIGRAKYHQQEQRERDQIKWQLRQRGVEIEDRDIDLGRMALASGVLMRGMFMGGRSIIVVCG